MTSVISDSKFQEWLIDDQARRAVLVELDHAAGTVYVSSKPYISEPDDADPNRLYDDALLQAIGVRSRLDGKISLGVLVVADDGEAVLGSQDEYWVSLLWRGHPVRIFLGDPFWGRDDFRQVAVGVNGGLQSSTSGKASFKILDDKALLKKPLQEAVMPDGSPVPIVLGKPFNIKPALENDPSHLYRVNESAISSVVVKDNGVTLSPAVDSSTGKFTLSAYPAGNITADVIESNDTAEKVVNWLCARYQLAANAASLALLPEYELGLYFSGESDATTVLDAVCASVGGYWRVSLSGEVEVQQMLEPSVTPDFILDADDIAEDGLSLIRVEEPYKKVTVNYQRNFSVSDRDSLAGVVGTNPALVMKMTEEWRQEVVTNTVADYPLAQDFTVDTYLTNQADAASEASRIAALRSVRREIWSIDCFVAPALAVIGQTVSVVCPRYGFSEGRNARILQISKSLTENKVNLEVWL